MSYTCPVNFIRVDNNISRINALFVSSLAIAYLLSSNIFILLFLAIDFSIKLFIDKKYAPLFILSKFVKNVLKLEVDYCDGGAKRLAAYFGLFFVLLLITTHFINEWAVSLAIAIIFISCALLDVFFNFCIGCKIYFIIKKIYPNFMSS
ncbi:MAG: hypothetical protein AUK54_09795 [Helicobacteraceae bacterium CG2_30_36_10]|nr:MAG: hypothetical protein AUK54_09795 [Helicobacteraceae bacterium CG2_30_36_10]